MNPLFLHWYLLTIVGNLPEELIIKILYHYSGLRHPTVNMLININNKRSYFKECISYIKHKECISYIKHKYSWREDLPIPKQVGYTFNRWNWKLNRSKYILESITCKGIDDIICGNKFYYNTNHWRCCERNSAYKLMEFEKYIEKQEGKKLPFGTHSKYYLCKYCSYLTPMTPAIRRYRKERRETLPFGTHSKYCLCKYCSVYKS